MIAFHRAFEMGHERRAFDRQIVIVFHGIRSLLFNSSPTSS
jgi:hypothetical protein